MAKVQTQLLLDPPVWARLNIVAAAAGIVRAEAARRAIEGKGLPAMEREYADEIETLKLLAIREGVPAPSLARRMLTDRILLTDFVGASSYAHAHATAQERHSRGRVVPA